MKEARAKEKEFFTSTPAYADLKNIGACATEAWLRSGLCGLVRGS